MARLKFPDLAVTTGIVLGAGAVILSLLGNPVNSGICISCFLENLAGSLQMHNVSRMSYIRPELIGFLLGSFLMAKKMRRFRVTGGSSPVIRFLLGFFMIVGCGVFIGCPIKMILRLAAGDLTAIAALLGLMFGIWLGSRYIRAGSVLDRDKELPLINGYILPGIGLLLLVFALLQPAFIQQGATGPAAQHAPMLISLAVGLLIGALSQRSGLCITGGLRNFFLFREKTLLMGIIAAFGSAMLISLFVALLHKFGVTEQASFSLGFSEQPGSHPSNLWSFLAMVLVGLAAVIVDGCPFRQLIKAGQGDVDAGLTCFGMLTGAAFVVSWQLRSTSAGPEFNGKIATLAGLIFCLTVVLAYRRKAASYTG
ncbi:YedE family putative selenium transporter [Candidatus Electronema sp. PJ]|uniref:YedE family putative selenium transporter n=1 Tax=Candidatus Electronema sp. PJ TaxID=3401572 RepID=UPI003AA9196B